MVLFSYCVRYDDGGAPNPFWGICTLVICKPAIRRKANIGDWVVGLGSANSPIGNISKYVVYAMRVTDKMTLRDYDGFCKGHCQNKIPQLRSQKEKRLRYGDCIYDYSDGEPPKQRWGIHKEENMQRDLGGEFALLSAHFYYFGDKPVSLPKNLHPIIHNTQGHKSHANQPYENEFISWISGSSYELNKLYGNPQLWPHEDEDIEITRSKCAKRDLEADEEDEALEEAEARA